MGRRNVISFSLFNAVPLYLEGARENAELAHTVYPGWKTRFYVDHTVPAELIGALVERQAEIVVVEGPRLGPQYGRFWRLWIAADADVDRFIVRDVELSPQLTGKSGGRCMDRVGQIVPPDARRLCP